MDPAPLTRPDHLGPADAPARGWLVRRTAAAIAVVLGVASFVVVAVTQPALWETPDARLSIPGLVVTSLAALASVMRRERAAPLWLVGVGMAGAAVVLGWFLMLMIVIGVTLTLILILHAVL